MTLWDKEPAKMVLNTFCVGYLLLGMQSTFKSSLFLSDTLSEETKFSFPSAYQFEIVSGLGIGVCVHFSFRFWVSSWCRAIQTCANLCRPCVYCLSLCELMCAEMILLI